MKAIEGVQGIHSSSFLAGLNAKATPWSNPPPDGLEGGAKRWTPARKQEVCEALNILNRMNRFNVNNLKYVMVLETK